jgi:hypothetical protein
MTRVDDCASGEAQDGVIPLVCWMPNAMGVIAACGGLERGAASDLRDWGSGFGLGRVTQSDCDFVIGLYPHTPRT